jgi:pyruvate,water dikinase
MVFKPTLQNKNLNPILKKHCGRKELRWFMEQSKETSAEKPP